MTEEIRELERLRSESDDVDTGAMTYDEYMDYITRRSLINYRIEAKQEMRRYIRVNRRMVQDKSELCFF